MTRFIFIPLLACGTVFVAGCASTPKPQVASALTDCHQLRVEIARAQEERRAAIEKKEGAWKGVIPFAVAAQYAVGKSAADAADRRLDELGSEAARRGCAS